MQIYPLFFLLVVSVGWAMALFRNPIWGLLTYVFIYFNIPSHQWWGGQVPDLRWSMIAAAILLTSCLIHSKKLASFSISKNPLLIILILLLLLMTLVAPITADPSMSWIKVYDFFRYVFVFFLICKIVTDFQKYTLFVGSILFCTFYLSILAHHYFRGGRLDGVGLPDASDANMLAALVLLVMPFYVVFFFTEKGWKRLAPLFALPLVINMFVMCGSRGAFVGIAVQSLLAFSFLRKSIGVMRSIICCLFVLGLLFSLMSPDYKQRLFSLQHGLEEDQSLGKASAGRTEIWKYGLLIVPDYPLGAGGGGFQALSPKYLPPTLMESSVGERASHNTYLLVLVEQGALGLLLFLLFIWCQFRNLRKLTLKLHHSKSNSVQLKIEYHVYAVAIGLAGFWSASFFIDRFFFECIYLVAALVPVLTELVNSHEKVSAS